MYRVVASTFADKAAAAVKSRNQLRAGEYPDAWLLLMYEKFDTPSEKSEVIQTARITKSGRIP